MGATNNKDCTDCACRDVCKILDQMLPYAESVANIIVADVKTGTNEAKTEVGFTIAKLTAKYCKHFHDTQIY